MGAESAFIKEGRVAAAPGYNVRIGDFSVKFAGVKPVAGPNYTAIEGTRIATTSSGSSFTMKPEARTFPGLMGTAPTETNEAALLTRPGGQLYRSEEHTSELQSLMRISYAVFCLKKKNNKTKIYSLKYSNTHKSIKQYEHSRR